MLTLRIAATIVGVTEPRILKVIGLGDFASGQWPIEQSLLDIRGIGSDCDRASLLSLPWAGVLAGKKPYLPADYAGVVVCELGNDEVVQPGDVIRLSPGARYVQNLYRRLAHANALFITERCNNWCLMCSQPPRNIDDTWRIPELFQTVDLIDQTLEWLGITGGEPTLIGERLKALLAHCRQQLPATGVHVLTNGRRFSDPAFAAQFSGVHDKLVWAVPLYGDTATGHDYVVQAHGAFADTVRGLYGLYQAGQTIEIRVVLQRPTVERLTQLGDFIFRSFPFVSHVAFMGLEPTGFALANRSALWIDPVDYIEALSDVVMQLRDAGIFVSIYNLPLCVLPTSLWGFSRRSISEWKQQHLPVCEPCVVRERCGGFFASHTADWQSRHVHALLV